MRYAISAIAVVLAVFACVHPVYASITAAHLGPKTTNYTGKCPKTLNFTGAITGTPGTTLIYSFNRFIGGKQYLSGNTSGTIPSGGSLDVSDSMTIPTTTPTLGRNFDQIWVHNISGGQTDVYSNEAHFDVDCGVPPTPKPSPLPFPTHLKNTVNQKVCEQHATLAGLFCNSALHAGDLVLVWNYKDKGKITGYHIYETGVAIYERVDTQNNRQFTISFLKPEKGGFGGLCYQVRAYKGKVESRPSNTFCVAEKYKYTGPPAVSQVTELQPTVSVCRWHQYIFEGFLSTYAGGAPPLQCGPIEIAFAHIDDGSGPWLYHENVDYQSALAFDQSAIQGLRVFKATLELTLPRGGGKFSCYGGLGFVPSPFDPNGGNWIQGDFSTFPTEAHFGKGSNQSIDVTGIVKAWASGKTPNYGFVTRSSDENFGAEDNGWCFLNFENNAVLRIEHY
jgi:hypothetical protein